MNEVKDHVIINGVVKSRVKHTDEISVFEIASVDGSPLPSFEAGAHIDLLLNPGLIRQYSISNEPGSSIYRLGILNDKKSKGGSRLIHQTLNVNSQIKITSPRNHFPLNMSAEHSLLIGGGIGITPMISMAYALKKSGKSFDLHYVCRSRDKAAFLEELTEQFGFSLCLHFDDEINTSFNVSEVLERPSSDVHLYVCGPSGFMDWVISEAKKKNIPEKNIHYEYFSAEVDIKGNEFEVFAKNSNVTVTVKSDQSIANALKSAGVKVKVSCEEGVCGTCICDVVEGIPDHRDHFLTDDEREDNDQIALCCSRAKTEKLILNI